MKNTVLTLALMTAMGAFIMTSNANSNAPATADITCDGGHKCDDKCKKDKDGKCSEAKASAENKGDENAKPSCCKKGEKSCHGEKGKSKESKKELDPKS
ncbi:MAG: hypothetical protein RIC15_00450 [Vicingaceae bacterium]